MAVRSAVAVDVETAPSNGRCLFAGVDIGAPPDVVWAALTEYDGLDSFIPGAPRITSWFFKESALFCLTGLRAALLGAEACRPERLAQRPARVQLSALFGGALVRPDCTAARARKLATAHPSWHRG